MSNRPREGFGGKAPLESIGGKAPAETEDEDVEGHGLGRAPVEGFTSSPRERGE